MGRYKRHQRKNRGTTTIVANPPIPNGAYPRNYNACKEPEISDRVKSMLVSTPKTSTSERGQLISNLMADMLLSIKSRGKYLNFRRLYHVDRNVLCKDAMGVYAVFINNGTYRVRLQLRIGNDLLFRGRLPDFDNYKGLVNRCLLLNEILQYDYSYERLKIEPIYKHEILGYYAKDELQKQNVVVYPNELALGVWVGTIFACISLLFITWGLASILSLNVALVFSLFVSFVTYINRD